MQSHQSWLQRFSTAEIATLVFVFSVMGAIIWYKKVYEPHVAIIPSKSAASQVTATPLPIATVSSTPTPTPSEANPFQAAANPFADVYRNPFNE